MALSGEHGAIWKCAAVLVRFWKSAPYFAEMYVVLLPVARRAESSHEIEIFEPGMQPAATALV